MGRCLGTGTCTRYRVKPPRRRCIVEAHELSNAECQTDCGVYSESCQGCLDDKISDECKSLPSYGCFACVKSIIEAFEQCQTNQTLECIADNIPSDCTECICTLACQISDDDSTICNSCNEISSTPGSEPERGQSVCPPGWSPSYAPDRKCFKVFGQTTLSWLKAQKECYDQGYQLAIADTEQKINGIADAMTNQRMESCWIGGRSSSATPLLFDWMPAPQTGLQSKAIVIDHWRTRDNCPKGDITETCMYVDRNGDWCDDKCTKSKCYVCEAEPEFLDSEY